MARLTSTLSLKARRCEADGSECFLCGDMIFLFAWEAVMFINGIERGVMSFKFCGSCGEIVAEHYGEIEDE